MFIKVFLFLNFELVIGYLEKNVNRLQQLPAVIAA